MNENKSNKRLYWNRKMITLLIQLFKENECLYDKKHEDYHNRSEKMEAYKSILNEMKKFLPQLKLEEVRRKIQIVRSQFSCELGLIESAEAVGVMYESKLWFFQQLSFLRKHISRLPKRKKSHSKDIPYDDDTDSKDGGKSLCEELAVDKDSSSQESLTGNSEIRRRHIKIKWNSETTEKFIKFFQRERCLYDTAHEDFADREKRAEARQRMVVDMQQYAPSICLHDVLVKIKCLRSQYSRELRRMAKAAENNSKYKPRLWCFSKLSYLKSPHSNDGPSEMDEHDNTTRQDEEDAFSNEDVDDTDTNDGIETTNEDDEEELHTENYEEEIEYEDLENNAIHEIPNEIIPNKNQICCGRIKEIDSKTSLKTESNVESEQGGRLKVDNNYDWLGRLVVSQLDEISPSYRNEFAWDVQRLARKYILKSKGEGESSSTLHVLKTSHQSKDLVFPRSSNVSLNISFI